MNTQAFDLSAVAAAATVGAVSFIDDLSVFSAVRAAGDNYATAGATFFKVAAAAALRVGDDKARAIAKDVWPDSKHPSREYFLKVCRAVKAAQTAGKAMEIADVAQFRELVALGKVTAAANDTTEEAPEQRVANAIKQAEQQAKALGEVSRLNKLANALETIEAQATKLLAHVPVMDATDNATLDQLLAGDAATLKNTTKAELIRMLAELCNTLADTGSAMRDSADVLVSQVAAVNAAVNGEVPAEQATAPAEQPELTAA